MKQLLLSSLRGLARTVGCELIPRWRLPYWEIATHLQELFTRLNIDCVLDVGANQGQYRDFLRLVVGYAGHIVSFEPVPALASYLKKTSAKEKAWTVYPYALGSSDSEIPINIMSRSDLNSFLEPDNSHVPELQNINATVRKELVPVKRLDSVIECLRRENPVRNVFLKMDTQGYDLEVMKGATATLPDILALQSEISILPIYSQMPDWITAVSFLKQKGFEVTGVFPVARDTCLRLIELDCVMINTASVMRIT